MKKHVWIAALLLSASPLAAQASSSCGLKIAEAQSLVLTDGTVEDESLFFDLSQEALKACKAQAHGWPSLRTTLSNAEKSCNEAANQGLSDLYRGYCYLKAADLAAWVLGR